MNYIGREPAASAAGITALDALAARVAALEAKQTIVAMVAAVGASVLFSGLPSNLKKLWLHLVGVSSNGASNLLAQIGDVSGNAVAGYHSNAGGMTNSALAGTQGADQTTGFHLAQMQPTYVYHGFVSFVLVGANTWVSHGILVCEASAWPAFYSAGSKVLPGALERIRLTTLNGTDTFDAGQVGIAYE